jgi:superfamily II DNA or RNA helicase
MTIELRNFQSKAIADYRAVYRKATSHLGIAATGAGKTIIMGYLARRLVESENWRIVILAHREALITQNADKVKRVAPDLVVSVERASDLADARADVISASVQTLRGKRLMRCADTWRADGRRIFLMTDEGHHALAPSYEAIRAALKPERELGVTATAFRPDDEGGASLRSIFPEIAFNIPRSDLIDDGWLAVPHHWAIRTGSSLVGMKARKGDYSDAELAERLDNLDRNQLIIETARDAAEVLQSMGRPVVRGVAFCLSVEHAKVMADAFQSVLGWDARAISAETPIEDRRAADAALRAGERHTILCNFNVLTEGWDVEEVNLGLFLRPTKSGVLADQMLGRVLRYHADKPQSLVVDFDDLGGDDRVSIASTFDLPRHWDGGGESLRADQLWFKEAVQGSSYAVRAALWRATTRPEVEALLANQEAAGVELVPDRSMIWWDLGVEARMVLGSSLTVVVRQTDLGDYVAEWRHGARSGVIQTAGSSDAALAIGEAWVEATYPQEAMFLRIGADAGRPATEKQVKFLAQLGYHPDEELTVHQARLLLNRHFMEQARLIERGIVGFGKHKGLAVSEVPTSYMAYALSDERMRQWMDQRQRPEVHLFESELAKRNGDSLRSRTSR